MNLTPNSDPLFSEKPLASDVIHLAGAGEREHPELMVLEAGDLGPGSSGSAGGRGLGSLVSRATLCTPTSCRVCVSALERGHLLCLLVPEWPQPGPDPTLSPPLTDAMVAPVLGPRTSLQAELEVRSAGGPGNLPSPLGVFRSPDALALSHPDPFSSTQPRPPFTLSHSFPS